MDSAVSQVKKLIKEKKTAEANKALPDAYKAIDKAVKRGLIKKNAASRKKSRLSQHIKNNK